MGNIYRHQYPPMVTQDTDEEYSETEKIETTSYLPSEIQAHIVSHVTDIHELLTLRLVCSEFREYARRSPHLTYSGNRSLHPRVLALFLYVQECKVFWPWEYTSFNDKRERKIIHTVV